MIFIDKCTKTGLILSNASFSTHYLKVVLWPPSIEFNGIFPYRKKTVEWRSGLIWTHPWLLAKPFIFSCDKEQAKFMYFR